MKRTINIILTIAIFLALGFVGACMWHLFELATNYTAGLFALAGY